MHRKSRAPGTSMHLSNIGGRDQFTPQDSESEGPDLDSPTPRHRSFSTDVPHGGRLAVRSNSSNTKIGRRRNACKSYLIVIPHD